MNEDVVGLRYHVSREIARAGDVTTYAARDAWLGQEVVLAQSGREDGSFEQAAAALRRASSPHLVSLYDAGRGDAEGSSFAAVPATSGTLADDGHQWDEGSAIELGTALSEALEAWHGEGLVHGDLHPGMVGFDARGRPLLSPWPLAPPPDGWGGPSGWRTSPLDERSGTPAGDLWSVGAVLLSALVGPGPSSLTEAEMDDLVGVLVAQAPDLAAVAAVAMTPPTAGGYASASELRTGLNDAGRRVAARPAAPRVVPSTELATAEAGAPAAAALVPMSARGVSAWRPRRRPIAIGSVAAAAMVAGFGVSAVGTGRTVHSPTTAAGRLCGGPHADACHRAPPHQHDPASAPALPPVTTTTASGTVAAVVSYVPPARHSTVGTATAPRSQPAAPASKPPASAGHKIDPGKPANNSHPGGSATSTTASTPGSSGGTTMGPSQSGLGGILPPPPSSTTSTTAPPTTTTSTTSGSTSTTTPAQNDGGGRNGGWSH